MDNGSQVKRLVNNNLKTPVDQTIVKTLPNPT